VGLHQAIVPRCHELAKKTIALFGENGAKVVDPVSLGLDLPKMLAESGSPSRYERITAINHYSRGRARTIRFTTQGTPARPRRAVSAAGQDNIEKPIDLNHDPEYRATLEGKVALRQAIVDLMDKYKLDALIYPHKLSKPLKIGPRGDPERQAQTNQISPVTGLPSLVVPMGFTADGLPSGLEILGRPWSEPTLIKIASGFEGVTKNRKLPATTPPLPGETIEY